MMRLLNGHVLDRSKTTHEQLVAWLEQQLKRGDLPPAKRKALANRLKANQHRPKTHNTGFYNTPTWKHIQKRRKQAQAAKRRNRR